MDVSNPALESRDTDHKGSNLDTFGPDVLSLNQLVPLCFLEHDSCDLLDLE